MNIVILGASSNAIMLAKRLAPRHDVVLVDINASERARYYGLDVVAIDGVVIDKSVLDEAGLMNADVVCALTDSENTNLVASQIAKNRYSVKKVLTCLYDTDDYRLFEDVGIVPISSTDLTVDAFIKAVLDDDSISRDQMGVSCVSLFGNNYKFKLYRIDARLEGTVLKKLADTEGGIILGVIRDGRLLQYDPKFKVENLDKVLIADMIE